MDFEKWNKFYEDTDTDVYIDMNADEAFVCLRYDRVEDRLLLLSKDYDETDWYDRDRCYILI